MQGNIKKWNRKVGDEVKPGVVLASIETDKAAVDFEMQEEGYVAALLFPEGAKDVPLGTPIAILVEKKSDIAAFANYTAASASAPSQESTPAEAQPATKAAESQPVHHAAPQDGSKIFVSPYAKKLANEKGIELN